VAAYVRQRSPDAGWPTWNGDCFTPPALVDPPRPGAAPCLQLPRDQANAGLDRFDSTARRGPPTTWAVSARSETVGRGATVPVRRRMQGSVVGMPTAGHVLLLHAYIRRHGPWPLLAA
jgi:hypothetical protein